MPDDNRTRTTRKGFVPLVGEVYLDHTRNDKPLKIKRITEWLIIFSTEDSTFTEMWTAERFALAIGTNKLTPAKMSDARGRFA